MKGTLETAAYRAGVIVNAKWPWAPPPECEWTDMALALSSRCSTWIVAWVGGCRAEANGVRTGKGKLEVIDDGGEGCAMVADITHC